MTPFDVIFDTFDEGGDADDVLAALADAGFVVVACPPGSRVVVSRESKPCEPCEGSGFVGSELPFELCMPCGGSGVVESTTIHGLEALPCRCAEEDMLGSRLVDCPVHDGGGLFRLAAVALPEDGE